jgi:tetratricopeptide (TPR) repeat protein
MNIKYNLLIALILLGALFFINLPLSIADDLVVDYLCDLGIEFYNLKQYDDALSEFQKVLAVDPENKTAKEYVNLIFKNKGLPQESQSLAPEVPQAYNQEEAFVPVNKNLDNMLAKEEAMERVFSNLESLEKNKKTGTLGKDVIKPLIQEESRGFLLGGLRVTGETTLSFGVESPGNFIWKRTNYDLNERNWRLLSDEVYNNRFNTFDTRIYDSLSFNLDTENKSEFNFHANITIDPWSFTGKSNKFTLTGMGGDLAELELRYWSNTRHTINTRVFTLANGDVFNLPEIKMINGRILPVGLSSAYSNLFDIPETKIKRMFQPVREFWFDYLNEDAGVKLRVFPIAYQDQAFTSDDPLNITNHHKWWAASPWLKRYLPGRRNPGASPVDYTKGRWDDTYSTVRDSTGRYLTALRGFSLSLGNPKGTLFQSTVATPKDLWQPYEEVDNYIAASRLKHLASENVSLGATFSTRTGLNVNNKSKVDSTNYTWGVDLSY